MEERTARVKVLLVDDHPSIRTELRQLLSEFPNVEVVGEARDGFQALVLADQLKPDIVLLDVRLPRMGGIAATRIMTQEGLCPRVVGISSSDDASTEQAMREAGACAFLSKTDAPSKLYTILIDAWHTKGVPHRDYPAT